MKSQYHLSSYKHISEDYLRESFVEKVMRKLPRKSKECYTRGSVPIMASVLVSLVVLMALSFNVSSDVESPLEFVVFGSHPSLMRMLDESALIESIRAEKPISTTTKTTTIIHGIFSTISESETKRRKWIRDTYLSNPDERLCSLTDYMNKVKELKTIDLKCEIAYTFVISGGGDDRPMEHFDDAPLTLSATEVEGADDSETDIMYLNIKENMEDGKSVSYFKAAAALSENYGIDYIAKTDSDSIFNLDFYFKFVEGELPPTPYNRRMYGGPSWGNYVKSSIYAAGQYYFLSSDLAHYVSNMMTHEQRKSLMDKRPTEDMDMGSFVFSHPRPIKFVNLSPFMFWYHPLKSEEQWFRFWEKKIDNLPSRGSVLPYYHLCPTWHKQHFY